MTLKVGRVRKPKLITQDLLNQLRQAGELSIPEIGQIANRYSQSSYEDEIRDLCELTGLCFHFDGVLSLRDDPLLQVKPEAERRFRFLTRMPHFRKWLQLHVSNVTSQWRTDEVTTADEKRVSRVEDFRESRFQTWADDLDDDLSGQTLSERIASGFAEPCRVTDDCLFYNTKGNGLRQNQIKRMIFLLVLLGAKAHGTAVQLEQLATTMECSVDSLHEWITAYLDPIGCPVQIVDDMAWVRAPITYESHLFDSIAQLLHHVGLVTDDIDFDQSVVGAIQSAFCTVFAEPPGQNLEQESVSIAFHANIDGPIFDGDSYRSIEDFVEDVRDRNPPENGYYLTGPSISAKSLRRPVQHAIRDFLESPSDANDISGESWKLAGLLRERFRFIGSLPIIQAGSPTELSEFGGHLQPTGVELPALRCLFFSANPWIRYLTVLSGMNYFFVRTEKGEWKVGRKDHTVPLSDTLNRAIAMSSWVNTIISPGRKEVDTSQLVQFALKLGIVEKDLATQRLDLPPNVVAELSEFDLLTWHDKIEQTLRQTILSQHIQ